MRIEKTKNQFNKAGWVDESRAIITSNGDLARQYAKYYINCDMVINHKQAMTPQELRTLAYYCEAIAKSFKAVEKYI